MSVQSDDIIRSRECSNCDVCGSVGKPLYGDLQDRLFSAPGKWQISQCTNPECGTLWLNPMPVQEDIIRAYQDYYTHAAVKVRGKSLKQRLKYYLKMGYTVALYGYDIPSVNWLQKLVAPMVLFFVSGHLQFDYDLMHLQAHYKGKVLEVGFGNADALKNMASLGWEVYGVDFDPIAVKNARDEGLEVRQGSLEEQNYSDQFFSAVWMGHVIEHVYDPLLMLRECYRILQPGGILVAVTPNVDSIGHKFFRRDWFNLDPPRHLHLFTPKALKRLAIEAGFTDVEVKTSRRDLYNTYLRSMTIHSTGKANMYINPNPIQERLVAFGAKIYELLQAKVTTQYGGEIILFAKKQS